MNRLRIARLIADLSRSVALLIVDIEHEETHTVVSDVSDPAYSLIARSLRRRRDNVAATIASLEALVQIARGLRKEVKNGSVVLHRKT